MLDKENDTSFGEMFEELVESDISTRGYDLYITSDGNYHCRECASVVKHHQNCPKCSKTIDWTKIIFGIEVHIIRLLKNDKTTVYNRHRIEEYREKACHMPDSELMDLYEGLYSNLGKEDLALLETSFYEVRKRYLKARKFLRRLFNKKYNEKWNQFIQRIESKATNFLLENIQK